MKIKVLATDVDGTLTDPNYRLSAEVISSIKKLESAGLEVILASGSSLPVLRTLQAYLGCSGPIIAENGGLIFLKDKKIKLGEQREAKKALEKIKEIDKIKESWQNIYRKTDLAFNRTIPSDRIRSVLQSFPTIKLLDSGFAYHLVNRRVDKGKALRKACKLMQIELKQVAACGDSNTDLSMLQEAGLSLAVANAPKEVKKEADKISSKPYGKGFAELAQWLLKKFKSSS